MNQEIPNTGGDTITNPVNANWQKTACKNVPKPFTNTGLTPTTQLTPTTEMGDFG